MISIKAILRKDLGKKDKEYRIDLRVYCEGKQYKLSTDQYCPEKYWDKNIGAPIKNIQDDPYRKKALQLEKFISSKKKDFDDYCRDREYNEKPILIDEIKSILKGENTNRLKAKEEITVEELFDLYIKALEANDKKKNSIINIESSKRVILTFIRSKYKRKVLASEIDRTFILDFKTFMSNKLKNKKGTINKRLRNLRSAFLEAMKQGFPLSNPVSQKGLITKDEPDIVVLTEEEYTWFKNVILPSKARKGLVLAKDLFVFCCETGLRLSDVKKLRWDEIKAKKTMLSLIQKKTEKLVETGISNQAKAIIIKYQRKNKDTEFVFDHLSDNTIRKGVKDIAEMANIKKNVKFHSSRHTFATNLAKAGMSETDIINLLGDSDHRMARVYINITRRDSVNKHKELLKKRIQENKEALNQNRERNL